VKLPATTLTDAFNACDPAQPLEAGDQRYVDLSPGRGNDGNAVVQCRQRIVRSERPLVQLFAGHRGCGKSTELRCLQSDLEKENYFVAYIEANTDIDLEDTEPTDILLSLIRGLDSTLRDAKIEVRKKHLEEFTDWFAEVVLEKTTRTEIEAEVRSEAEVSGGVPLFAKLLARFAGWIKTGRESKKLVRQRLDPQLSQLLSRADLFVKDARLAVQKAGKKDLILIVDSLDRIALKDLKDGRTSHEVLFIERGNLLNSLGCHMVVTIPLSLLFSPKASNLGAIFPDRHILPMVKIAERGTQTAWKAGRDLLKDLLQHRLELDKVFIDKALDELVAASGGHPRYLMTLVRYALDYIERLVNDFDRSIPHEHWPLLVRVHEQQTVQNDAHHQLMLFNLSVLEYQNDERWCDVHPAVLQARAFKEASKTSVG
jgi:DNA polymerase III delta prime subunit